MATKTVILLKVHDHGSRKHQPGTLLAIDAWTADWLVEQGIAAERPGVTAPVQKPARVRSGCCGGRW